jgi:peptide chain release factor 2
MKMLAAKLYELEVQKRNVEKDALEATKSDIGWGSQIRNYVLDQSRIKDLRTGIERTDTQKVLDGDLDEGARTGWDATKHAFKEVFQKGH